jgi:hypothetical protein
MIGPRTLIQFMWDEMNATLIYYTSYCVKKRQYPSTVPHKEKQNML